MSENERCSGWDAITNEFERIYPGQEEPKHYGTIVSWKMGGNDPLKGISVYEGKDYWHFVTYGLSELYEKESDNKEISGYGMEFTLKLRKGGYEDEEKEILTICSFLQSIARVTFMHGEIFKPYEYVYTGTNIGIDANQKSKITGLISIPDAQAKSLDTPNGRVDFVEFIGVTDKELQAIMKKEIKVAELYEKLDNDITDYDRESVI